MATNFPIYGMVGNLPDNYPPESGFVYVFCMNENCEEYQKYWEAKIYQNTNAFLGWSFIDQDDYVCAWCETDGVEQEWEEIVVFEGCG